MFPDPYELARYAVKKDYRILDNGTDSGFFKAAAGNVQEGSVIEIKIISPENKTIVTNFKVNSEDIALVNELKDLV